MMKLILEMLKINTSDILCRILFCPVIILNLLVVNSFFSISGLNQFSLVVNLFLVVCKPFYCHVRIIKLYYRPTCLYTFLLIQERTLQKTVCL